MLKVGLTGGIACGKSHALREFHKLGVLTIDADQITREVTQPHKPAYKKIVEGFGTGILKSDRTIDRKKLGKIVFSDESARARLNKVVHPYIFEEEQRKISEIENESNNLRSPILMVDAALMIETGSYHHYDIIIAVYCHPAIQLQRLVTRSNLSEKDALERINSQLPVLEKIKYAHYIIVNSGKLSETHEQIKHVLTELMELCEEGLG